jgi:hypothetical protein
MTAEQSRTGVASPPGAPATVDLTPRPKRIAVADLSLDELGIELSALTSTSRRLFASEERRRQSLLAEMGKRDDERAAIAAAAQRNAAFADVRALQARLASIEEPGSTLRQKEF